MMPPKSDIESAYQRFLDKPEEEVLKNMKKYKKKRIEELMEELEDA